MSGMLMAGKRPPRPGSITGPGVRDAGAEARRSEGSLVSSLVVLEKGPFTPNQQQFHPQVNGGVYSMMCKVQDNFEQLVSQDTDASSSSRARGHPALTNSCS